MLHLATFLNKIEIINFLINEKNLEIMIKDCANITPYDIAKKFDFKEIIVLFEKRLELSRIYFINFQNYFDLFFVFNKYIF
jgi:hypothetical protein